ncbi:MAG: 1,4-dihydroxy-2-naphthoate octaprenyltransferase [Chloroflexi bacterium]|nr:1,4-dihydroxy-2-naphthoate octaprenyltransferase [Chloroflexota bacterium]
MKDRWLSLASPILLVLIWEALVSTRVLNPLFFPPPSAVAVSFFKLLGSGELARHTSISVARVIVGFVAGAVPAIALGMLMGIWRPARLAIEPLAAAVYPIPKIAILPLIVILLGIGETSKIVTIAISVFFLVLLNTVAGVLAIDPRYFEVAQNLGARRYHRYWTVALPGALPSIVTGAKLGMGFALTVIVGTEFLGAREGIGALIWLSYQSFNIDTMFVGLVVVALLGWVSSWLLDELERLIIPWRPVSRGMEAESSLQRRLRVGWRATRPFSFTASVTPVLLGTTIAAYDGRFDAVLAALVVIGSVAIHAGTNMVNDYFDDRKGVDQPSALGPSGVIQQGLMTRQQVLMGGLTLFALGSLIGLYLTVVSGPFILWLGIFSVAAGFFYTAGPAAIAYIGLGEMTVFLFMGPVMVLGAYYVQAHTVDLRVFLLSLPIAFLVAAILHANNLRDIESDRRAGKHTLATIIGRHWGTREYFFLLAGAYVVMLVLIIASYAPVWMLLTLLTLPIAINGAQQVATDSEPRKLNGVIRRTADLHARFGQLMIISLVLAMALGRLTN